jgi:hypothetical protein
VSQCPPVARGPFPSPGAAAGDRTRLNEIGIGGGYARHGPYPAGIQGGLSGGAGRATLKGVGVEKVGDDLLIIVVEQGGLWPEECPGEARG